MLHHGGRLIQEALLRNSDPKQWLDLSTGISPISYPIPEIPSSIWHRLPEDEDGLLAAASEYYGYPELLPVAGSQAAIMCLPRVLVSQYPNKGTVLMPSVGYREHAYAWQNGGWSLEYYDTTPNNEQLSRCAVLLIINPNNPTTHKLTTKDIDNIESRLTEQQVLIIDEAFMDGDSDNSRLSFPLRANTIVLRSLGKFFGLAGLRVGFVAANGHWLDRIGQELGPWTLSGASRYIAKVALFDRLWQQSTARELEQLRSKQFSVIKELLPKQEVVSASLFMRIEHSQAPLLFDFLCDELVLVRLCDEKDAIRLGLCADSEQLLRLEQALTSALKRISAFSSPENSPLPIVGVQS
ncbi:threonine-phosphate decarboxylase [Vibrio fluminensis]|uniref:threonine-phosphate decarboxylase n=1 Tax=Vibrio fluminensis TaxID=2783614 RepID=UPI00188883D5|nr:threonine-phosphate decarboxylase [Vibrio fluminensis]